MKKLSLAATILAVIAGLLAGAAIYIIFNGRTDDITVDTLSDASAAESGREQSTDAAPQNTADTQSREQDAADTQSREQDTSAASQDTAPATADAQAATASLDPAAAQAIHDAYISAAQNAAGDMERGYYIYDIDKDNIPELLLTHEDGNSRGLAVWTYTDGKAVFCDVMWGFAHGYPFPASYPDGNGIVLEETAREYECIWVISKNGTSLSDTVHNENCSVYSENITEHGIPYYTDIEDNYGTYFNHQYRPSTDSPYFAGSQALGLSDPADDTAIREALGMA